MGIAIFVTCCLGEVLTGLKLSMDFMHEDLELTERDGLGYSANSTTAYAMLIILAAVVWPVYWTCRLLNEGVDQLMLPPGDSV